MCSRLFAPLLLLGVLVVPGTTEAQAPAPASRPAATGTKVESPPLLDGDILNEALWQTASAAGGFIQKNPSEGAPASQRTEVRILYTTTALYIGVICFDD